MEELIFWIIFSVVVFDYVFEQCLEYLNTIQWSNSLPKQLKGIYNGHEYRKSQLYRRANYRLGMITSALSFAAIVAMLLLDGFACVDSLAAHITEHYILSALVFFLIIGFANDLISTPFDVYDTFYIEERFGFNKTSKLTYVFDKVKGWLLAAILGGGMLALIMWLWSFAGSWFWLIAWGVVSGISVFFAMFYSSIIVPLFNKQTPLEDGELKQEIEIFASKAGFKLNNIFVIDGSKRSTKANAYFTGLGTKKRIVLYDTLINDLSTPEIVAVLAHEVGHYKKKHIISGLLAGILQTGLMLYVFSLLVSSPALSGALGVDEPKFHIGLIAFGILYSPLSFILGIGMNVLSRKNEYEADNYAANYGFGKHLASALKKLSVKNLSNLTPHKWYVFFHYSHPTLLQRLGNLNKE
jgi:STE24 endopeptidase